MAALALLVGNIHGKSAKLIGGRSIRASLDENPDRLQIAVTGRPMQRRIAVGFVEIVPRADRQEVANGLDTTPRRRSKQCGFANRIPPVHVGSRLHKLPDLIEIPGPHGSV